MIIIKVGECPLPASLSTLAFENMSVTNFAHRIEL